VTPRRLELNFLSPAQPLRWINYGILALVLLAGLKLAGTYFDAERDIDQLEARKSGTQTNEKSRIPVTSISDATVREADQINLIIDTLTVPWDKLFRSVEAVHRNHVALLAITPDEQSGTVEISGEAADPGAMFDYIDRLQDQPALTRVYLVAHKANDQDPQHSIRFTVSASWLEHNSH
jgi:Tfp pilus assembly protein PilN